jgi:hypothetical protein
VSIEQSNHSKQHFHSGQKKFSAAFCEFHHVDNIEIWAK